MTKMKLRRELREKRTRISNLEYQLEEEKSYHNDTRYRLSEARKRASELERVEAQNERLKEELEDARLSAAWYRKEMLCLREEIEELQRNTNKTGF